MHLDQERKAGFQTSTVRFQQYNQWAKKTSQFVGPGVYEDHEKFRSLTKQPCTALYRPSHYMKEGGGQDGYMFINGNMIQYEPCFDKSK